jgi:hypothetical protein
MRTIHATFRDETIDEQIAAGRYNPATQAIVRLRDRSLILTLGAGRSDDVTLLRDGDTIVVVSVNTRHDYCGI